MGQTTLEGMPEPAVLRLHTIDGQVLVDLRTVAALPLRGGRHRDAQPGDRGVDRRRPAGRRGRCGVRLTATYVLLSCEGGPARTGRPPWCAAGAARPSCPSGRWLGAELGRSRPRPQSIAERLGVAQSVISELLARRGPLAMQPELPEPEPAEPTAPNTQDAQASTAEPVDTEPVDSEPVDTEPVDVERGPRSRVRLGSAPARSGAGMPGRCCCTRPCTSRTTGPPGS